MVALAMPSMGWGKPDVINLIAIGDASGPYSAIGGASVPGMQDACQYVNEVLGGVDGVKIKVTNGDNKGEASLGLQLYASLIQMKPKPIGLFVYHSPTGEALRAKVLQDGIIGLFPTSIAQVYPRGNTYGIFALYAEQLAVGMKYIRDTWKEERNPRVAILTWDTAYGRGFLTPEFFDYCKKIGVDIVAQELFGIRDVDITTHLVRIREKNPDWLASNTTLSGPVAIMKAAKELGMPQKLVCGFGLDWTTVRINPKLFDGCIAVMHTASFDDPDNKGIQTLKKLMAENKRTEKEISNFYITGWEFVLVMHEALKNAVAKVGWDKLDTAAINVELQHMDYAPLDGVVRVDYTEKRRTPSWLKVYKIENGKFLNAYPKGDFVKAPDLTPAEYR